MEMNDILNGLSSCEETTSSDSSCASDNCCGGQNMGQLGLGAGPLGFGGGLGNGFGCGFGCWIWILLILFYSCGGNGLLGGCNNSSNGYGSCNNSCCNNSCCNNSCCCNNGNNNGGGLFGGLFGNCTAYLFLLVILFLCNSNFNGIGCGSPYGALGGYGANLNVNGNYGC